MIVALIFFIAQAYGFEETVCRNHTILQTPGDALLTVFVDATLGPHCNESSPKGFQELTTALYVTTTLNREDYIPGITLGLRLIDTCQNRRSVQKTCLLLAAEPDCAYDYYNLGVLAPEGYIPALQPLQEITDLPLAFYFNDNITKPLVNIAIDFIARKFETIDLLLTDTDSVQRIIADGTRETAICVDSFNNLTKLDNTDNGLIVAAGEERSIRSWLEGHWGRNTWVILPLDDSEPDDVVPPGSYIIKPESLSLDLVDYLTPDIDDRLVHSPHLLTIGKSLVSIAELLSDVQRSNCPSGICGLPPFDPKLLKKISMDHVFEALKTPDPLRTIKYVISQRVDAEVEDLVDILSYQVDVETFKVISNVSEPHVRSCWSRKTCKTCRNFGNNPTTSEIPPVDESTDEKSAIRADYWVPVVMVLVGFGTAISLAVGAYIIYKFSLTEPLDGNPTLTMLLVLGNIFLLFSTTPFCLEENILGHEELNSRKIFVATLSTGFVFSVMLSRAFFLAFSTGGVYTSHINGYLQGLMLLFVFGVQIGLSTMYFVVAPRRSEEILRSPIFIGLLAYDILLLLMLLAAGWLIHRIPRNYREGKCLFLTAVGLLSTWCLWITIFLFASRDWRDVVVTFALVLTSYVVISGVLLPRVYLMITHAKPDKTFQGHTEGANLRFEPRRRTIRQGIENPGGVHSGGTANFYGSSSPSRRGQADGGMSTGVNSKVSGYSNFGYRNEMQEGENHYVVPRVCVIQNNDAKKNRGSIKSTTSSDSDYAQPNYPGMRESSLEDDCLEAELYLDSKRLSPKRGPNETYPSRCSTPRLYQTEATIDEEDEDTEETSKVTRF